LSAGQSAALSRIGVPTPWRSHATAEASASESAASRPASAMHTSLRVRLRDDLTSSPSRSMEFHPSPVPARAHSVQAGQPKPSPEEQRRPVSAQFTTSMTDPTQSELPLPRRESRGSRRLSIDSSDSEGMPFPALRDIHPPISLRQDTDSPRLLRAARQSGDRFNVWNKSEVLPLLQSYPVFSAFSRTDLQVVSEIGHHRMVRRGPLAV
jgi:hypothetical protein